MFSGDADEKLAYIVEGGTDSSDSDIQDDEIKLSHKLFTESYSSSTIMSRIRQLQMANDGEESSFLDISADFLIEKIRSTTLAEGIEILNKALEYHEDDINFPNITLNRIHLLVQGPEKYDESPELYELDIRIEAVWIKWHSPYPEVRGVTDAVDDSDVPIETIRVYIIGLVWSVVGAYVNETFRHHQPKIELDATIMQILLYPCGKLFQLLPNWSIKIRGKQYSLNPGPWTAKVSF